MRRRTKLKIISLSIGLLCVSLNTAQAQDAIPTANLNIRSGPGVQYQKIGTLRKGVRVEISECSGNWCLIDNDGQNGWASKNYLAKAPPLMKPETQMAPRAYCDRSGERPSGNCEPTRKEPDPGHSAPLPLPQSSKTCFYSEPNYRGSKFCVKPGQGESQITGFWKNRIASMKVIGKTKTRICTESSMSGLCRTIINNQPNLRKLGGNISSYRVSN